MKKIIIMFLLVFGVFTFFTSNVNASDCTSTTKPWIKVTSPTAGQTYTIGQKIPITWTSCNVENLYIDLLSGGKEFGGSEGQDKIPASLGSYEIIASNPAKGFTERDTNSYEIGIYSSLPDVIARSDTFYVTSLTSNNAQPVTAPTITNIGNCINLTYSLKFKDKDINRKGEVTILQKFLKDKGYLNVLPTGYFGTLTLKAVKSFQKANGINQTGLVGSITRGKIKASCADSGSNLKVVSPNGGEQYKIGDKVQIKWTGPVVVGPICPLDAYCATPQLSYEISLINRHPCLDSVPRCLIAEYPPEIVASNLGSINSFEWTVGSVKNVSTGFERFVSPGSNYKIQVCENIRGICDTSDKIFTINTLNTNNITTTSLYVNAITTYNPWPPKVESSVERYSCSLSHTEMSDTIEKIVNGHTYCITTQTESAAGSTYRTYTYKTFGIQGTSLKTTFSLRYSNCGNYDGVSEKGDACRDIQKNINVDSIVDSLMY